METTFSPSEQGARIAKATNVLKAKLATITAGLTSFTQINLKKAGVLDLNAKIKKLDKAAAGGSDTKDLEEKVKTAKEKLADLEAKLNKARAETSIDADVDAILAEIEGSQSANGTDAASAASVLNQL